MLDNISEINNNMDLESLVNYMIYLYPKNDIIYQYADKNIIDQCIVDKNYDTKVEDEIYLIDEENDDDEIYYSDNDYETKNDIFDSNENEFGILIDSKGFIGQTTNTVVKEDIRDIKTPLHSLNIVKMCNKCGKSDVKLNEVSKHMITNHNMNIFNCDKCNYKKYTYDLNDKPLMPKGPAFKSYNRTDKNVIIGEFSEFE